MVKRLTKTGLGHKVVMQLMEAYQGKGHCEIQAVYSIQSG